VAGGDVAGGDVAGGDVAGGDVAGGRLPGPDVAGGEGAGDRPEPPLGRRGELLLGRRPEPLELLESLPPPPTSTPRGSVRARPARVGPGSGNTAGSAPASTAFM